MVKNSLSSTIINRSTRTSAGCRGCHYPLLGFKMLVVLFFLITSTAASPETTSSPRKLQDQGQITSSRNNHHRHYRHRACDSFSHEKSRSLCNQFHGNNRHNRPLLPPSPSPLSEIDPRYGVEKRLVPSGPNPLHN